MLDPQNAPHTSPYGRDMGENIPRYNGTTLYFLGILLGKYKMGMMMIRMRITDEDDRTHYHSHTKTTGNLVSHTARTHARTHTHTHNGINLLTFGSDYYIYFNTARDDIPHYWCYRLRNRTNDLQIVGFPSQMASDIKLSLLLAWTRLQTVSPMIWHVMMLMWRHCLLE